MKLRYSNSTITDVKPKKQPTSSFSLLKKRPKIYLDATEDEDDLGGEEIEVSYSSDGRTSEIPIGTGKLFFIPSSSPPFVQLGFIIQVSVSEQVVLPVDNFPKAVLNGSHISTSDQSCIPAYSRLHNETSGITFPMPNPVTSISFDATSQTFYYLTSFDTEPLLTSTTSSSDIGKIIPSFFNSLVSKVMGAETHLDMLESLKTLQDELAARGGDVEKEEITKTLSGTLKISVEDWRFDLSRQSSNPPLRYSLPIRTRGRGRYADRRSSNVVGGI